MFFIVAVVVVVAMHKLIEIPLYIFNYLVCVRSVLIKHVVLVLVVVVAVFFLVKSRVIHLCIRIF